MAKSSQLMEEISEQFLICTLCFEKYDTPKTLSCMHAFCAHCLEKHMESEQERYRYMFYTRTVSCPVCLQKTDVPNGGVRKLPDNYLLTNLIDIFERRKSDAAKAPTCEICTSSTKFSKHFAISKCLDCNKVLCRSCCDTHTATKVTQSHHLVDIEMAKDIQCKIHEEESLRYYCEPCQSCICVLCTFEDHKNHEIETLNEGLTKHRDCLDSLLEKCKERIENVKNRLEEIRDCENKIKDAEEFIRDTAITSVSTIRQREKFLTQEIRKYYGQDTYDFLNEKQSLKDKMETLKHTCNLTELVLKDKNIELLLLKKDLQSKLESLTQEKLNLPPKNTQKHVKFVPGSLNLGFLQFQDGPPPKPVLMKDVVCHCRLCRAEKVDNFTMTPIIETSSKQTDTEMGQMMKRMTQTDPVSVTGKYNDTESISETDTISNLSESGSETVDTVSSYTIDSTDWDDASDILSSSCNISLDDLTKCENFFNKKTTFTSTNCQTDSYLLDDLLTETNLVFHYNISKLLPEKKDFGTTVDFGKEMDKFPRGLANGLTTNVDDFNDDAGHNRDSVISANSETDMNECFKKIGMNDSGIQMNESHSICKICQLNMDSNAKTKTFKLDSSNEYVTTNAEEAVICKFDRGTSPIKALATHRGTSPVRSGMKHKETMTNIETRNRGVNVCPKMKNSCTSTPRVVLKDKAAYTPHLIMIEKETCTPTIHLLHKNIGTEIESYQSKVDKQTNTIDITQIYLEAASNRSNMVKKVSRAEGTDHKEFIDRQTSPDRYMMLPEDTTMSKDAFYVLKSAGTDGNNHVSVDTGTQYGSVENSLKCNKKDSDDKQVKKLGGSIESNKEEIIVQKETGFEPVLVQNGKSEKQTVLTGGTSSLPKVIMHTVERGMNTKTVDTHHKETSTPPREMEDKSVTTGTDLATKVDDKITHCISKLKVVSEKLGHGSKSLTKINDAASTESVNAATPLDEKTNEKPVKSKFSLLSSFLGRRQSEGDILKAKSRENSNPKKRELLARKQTTNMAQMMQPSKHKEGSFFSFSKPKLTLKAEVVPKLGSAEELTGKQDLQGSSKNKSAARTIPGRPPLPAPKLFKKSPVSSRKAPPGGAHQ